MSAEWLRGFILRPTYEIVEGKPVILLFGKLETGESFLIRDRRETPTFFVEQADLAKAAGLGAHLELSDHRSLAGKSLAAVKLQVPADAPPLRDELAKIGVPTYEADLRFAVRYLIRRGLKGALAIRGPWQKGRGIDRIYLDPELAPAELKPKLRILSIDIETDPRAERLLSIGLAGEGVAEVLLHCPDQRMAPAGAVRLLRERDLLSTLCRRVREIDPDVITGWNVVDFDLRVLDRLARKYGVRLELGRGPGVLRLRPSRSPAIDLEALLPGRVVVDGIQLLRGAFVRFESYGLGAVAREVLGEGKLLEGDNRAWEILDAFTNDPQKLVDYNLKDAQLVLGILDKLHLIELAVERSLLTGLPIDRVAGSIAAFDFLYLSEMSKRSLVAPSVGAVPTRDGPAELGDSPADLGGHVLEPLPGLYRNVWVFDFKSLYPSLIRTFQIDPLGFEQRQHDPDPIIAPNGAAFARRPGILPLLLDDLFPRRESAKRAGDAIASHAIKILMNSCYGVLGTSACRFYQPQIASAITSWGRTILLWSKAFFEARGLRVVYGDTDSLFVSSADATVEQARATAVVLVDDLNRAVAEYVRAEWRVESKLELEFEKLYSRLFLFSVRGGQAGARKRYAGLVDDGGAGRVELVGLEAVRSDWTELAKGVQRELFERLFRDQDVSAFLREVVARLRRGELDQQLVYKKALRKPLADYTATTPPHVAAARKSQSRPGRSIAYVMTSAGAEPWREQRNPFDYEHYVHKQIKPIALPVLERLNLDFASVIGDRIQLSLF